MRIGAFVVGAIASKRTRQEHAWTGMAMDWWDVPPWAKPTQRGVRTGPVLIFTALSRAMLPDTADQGPDPMILVAAMLLGGGRGVRRRLRRGCTSCSAGRRMRASSSQAACSSRSSAPSSRCSSGAWRRDAHRRPESDRGRRPTTVASVHVSRILAKLGINSRAKATTIAYEEHLLTDPT